MKCELWRVQLMMDDCQKVHAQALVDLNKMIIYFNEKELSM
jgi:hypothetical protein